MSDPTKGKFYYEFSSPQPAREVKDGDVLSFAIDTDNASAYTFKNPMTLVGHLLAGGSFMLRVSGDVSDEELAEMVRQIREARDSKTWGGAHD